MGFTERDISLALISSLGTALCISVLININNGTSSNDHYYRNRNRRRNSGRKSRSDYLEEDDEDFSDDTTLHDGNSTSERRGGPTMKKRHRGRRVSKRASMDTIQMNNLSDEVLDNISFHDGDLNPKKIDQMKEIHEGDGSVLPRLHGEESHTTTSQTGEPIHLHISTASKDDLDDVDDTSLATAQSTTTEVVSISKSGKTRRKRLSMISTGSIGSNSDHLYAKSRGATEIVTLTSKHGEIGGQSVNGSGTTSSLNDSKSSKSLVSPIAEKSHFSGDSRGASTINTLTSSSDQVEFQDSTSNSASQVMTQADSMDQVNDTPVHDDKEEDVDDDEEMNLQLFIGVDETDKLFQEFMKVDEILIRSVKTVDQSLSLLRRTRCLNFMGNKLMLAENESQCFEQVSKLLVSLFKVERSTYTLMIDEDHFTILHCTVTQEGFARQLAFELAETGLKAPLKGTAIEYCKETLEALYTPRAKHSKYLDHQKLMKTGLRSFMNVPILVGERQFAGCLNIGLVKEDPFTELDISLIQDIASMLGTHVFSKRLQRCKNESHQISQQLLHSFIPPQIIEKIEHYWAAPSSRSGGQLSSSQLENDFPRSISLPEESVESINRSKKERFSHIKEKLELIQEYGGDASKSNNQLKFMNTNDNQSLAEPRDMSSDISMYDGSPASHALYAENASNISILFSDIVGFSKIALEVPPIMIMDMLQHLFHLFDVICKKHGVHKLETIGDAYLCSAGLLEHDMDETTNDKDHGKNAALRALAMAKDMVREARKVPVPKKNSSDETQFLEIRVGIHVGEVTYGVLGQTIPKLVCIGNTVNMAARMEQNSCPSKIRVTQSFYELVGEEEKGWEKNQIVQVKNMGTVSSWLLDPLKDDGAL